MLEGSERRLGWNKRGSGWQGHLIFALIVTFIVIWVLFNKDYWAFGFLDALLVILVGTIWGLMPDIDQRNSKIHQAFILVSAATVIMAIVFDQRLLAVIIAVLVGGSQILHHRGFMHTILAAVIFSVPLIVFHWVYALIGFIAFLSHLVLDGKLHICTQSHRH